MIEKWRSSLSKGGSFGALLTHHFKAFDCLNQLLNTKIHAYGLNILPLNCCTEIN